MTRYLDRDPVMGDRVHVEFDGVVIDTDRTSSLRFPLRVCPDAEQEAEWDLTPMMVVRVIAPEPKAGDVVTEDMEELPDQSVLFDGSIAAVRAIGGEWFITNYDGPVTWRWLLDLPWTIVRIGGAS